MRRSRSVRSLPRGLGRAAILSAQLLLWVGTGGACCHQPEQTPPEPRTEETIPDEVEPEKHPCRNCGPVQNLTGWGAEGFWVPGYCPIPGNEKNLTAFPVKSAKVVVKTAGGYQEYQLEPSSATFEKGSTLKMQLPANVRPDEWTSEAVIKVTDKNGIECVSEFRPR